MQIINTISRQIKILIVDYLYYTTIITSKSIFFKQHDKTDLYNREKNCAWARTGR